MRFEVINVFLLVKSMGECRFNSTLEGLVTLGRPLVIVAPYIKYSKHVF